MFGDWAVLLVALLHSFPHLSWTSLFFNPSLRRLTKAENTNVDPRVTSYTTPLLSCSENQGLHQGPEHRTHPGQELRSTLKPVSSNPGFFLGFACVSLCACVHGAV